MKKLLVLCLSLVMTLLMASCSENDDISNNDTKERLGFAGANIGMGGLMAGDGEWIYYRNEADWGLYKAKTDGSEKTLLLPTEDYSPSNLNVLDEWVYFSNYRDGFSIYRVQTDGTAPEKLANGYCSTVFVADSGIYFDWRDDNNVSRTFRMNLDGSEQELLAEGFCPVTYYDEILYLYDFRLKTLSSYNVKTKETAVLNESINQAAYFSSDENGIYYWDNMNAFCYLNPKTGAVSVLRGGPIGDYYNYMNGKAYFVAYGGSNYDYTCCYSLDIVTKIETPILSLSKDMFDYNGEPIGLTQVDYRNGNYNPKIIPKDESGLPMILNEQASELYIINDQVFSRGLLKDSIPSNCWIYCDGHNGQLWG